MLNILISIAAIILFIIGLISMVTPIPGGTLMIAASMAMLICSSSKAQACVRFFRTKNEKVNKTFFWMEDKIGTKINFIGKALMITRPLSKSR